MSMNQLDFQPFANRPIPVSVAVTGTTTSTGSGSNDTGTSISGQLHSTVFIPVAPPGREQLPVVTSTHEGASASSDSRFMHSRKRSKKSRDDMDGASSGSCSSLHMKAPSRQLAVLDDGSSSLGGPYEWNTLMGEQFSQVQDRF